MIDHTSAIYVKNDTGLLRPIEPGVVCGEN